MTIYTFSHTREKYCDCRRGLIYYPDTDDCYQAYRKGPCESEKYLILEDDVVQCVDNPCKIDGHVRYKGRCYPLGSKAPCEEDYILEVNKVVLRPECSDVIMPFLIVDSPQKECPAGTRRNFKGVCKHVL